MEHVATVVQLLQLDTYEFVNLSLVIKGCMLLRLILTADLAVVTRLTIYCSKWWTSALVIYFSVCSVKGIFHYIHILLLSYLLSQFETVVSICRLSSHKLSYKIVSCPQKRLSPSETSQVANYCYFLVIFCYLLESTWRSTDIQTHLATKVMSAFVYCQTVTFSCWEASSNTIW